MFDVGLLCFLFCSYVLLLLTYNQINGYITSIQYILLNALNLFILLFILLYNYNEVIFHNLTFNWISTNLTENLGTIPFSLNFSLNYLSFCFSSLVLLIGGLTNIYLLTYFKGEASTNNFTFWLNSFIISMLILLLANNLFTLFLGWELIGLASFFLINFWTNRRATLKSSFKAFIFNLFSDICLLGSFVILFYLTGTDDCSTILYISLYTNLAQHILFKLSVILLICCCAIKSVQLFGHLWLPDSMEAPVPASSLIHSATLVSAGIYLLCKFNLLLEIAGFTSMLLFIGGISAMYGGFVAATQTDVKKLLAYSTMSHCGFLWVLASNGQIYITIIYLFLHGLFKAATFYSVGSFIRVYGTQDTRWMGSGLRFFTGNSLGLLLCSANLCGLPFTIGYFYKFFFFKFLYLNIFSVCCLIFLFIAAQTSIIYFYRLTFYLLYDFYKNIKKLSLFYLNKTSIFTLPFVTNHRVNFFLSYSLLFVITLFLSFYFYLPVTFQFTNMLEIQQISLPVITVIEQIYSFNYIYFYIVYSFILIFLILTINKKQYTHLFVLNSNIFFLLIVFFTIYL